MICFDLFMLVKNDCLTVGPLAKATGPRAIGDVSIEIYCSFEVMTNPVDWL